MTTQPWPADRTELELALHNARVLVRPVADYAVPHDPIRVMLATALLDLHAKLTARRVPTRDELVRVIRDELCQPVPASDNRTASEACADAVMRLFAEADGSGPPVAGEPPDPFIREAPPDSEIGQYHELDRGDPGVRWFEIYSGPGTDGCATWGGADGWRMDGSVRGWRRAQQRAAEPTPEAAWNYKEPPDTERGKLHELLASDHAPAGLESVMRYTGRDPDGDPAWGQGQRILGWSVKAWRPASEAPAKGEPQFNKCAECRGSGIIPAAGEYMSEPCPECNGEGVHPEPAKPAEPSPQPGGFLDALTRRVYELEAQTRALRRFALDDYPYGPAGEGPEGALARIEREERERAK